ncbi:MAG: hypothetical protein O6948_11965, partial [Deltaproteobacteria bacterium]|nr:hypothetical protein [Deltaproteobacteria bacterium]
MSQATFPRSTRHFYTLDREKTHKTIRRGLVFVEIETDQGITGYGLTSYALHSAIKEFINADLAPFLLGKDPLLTERIWDQMFW